MPLYYILAASCQTVIDFWQKTKLDGKQSNQGCFSCEHILLYEDLESTIKNYCTFLSSNVAPGTFHQPYIVLCYERTDRVKNNCVIGENPVVLGILWDKEFLPKSPKTQEILEDYYNALSGNS